jgi:hypothetical protein
MNVQHESHFPDSSANYHDKMEMNELEWGIWARSDVYLHDVTHRTHKKAKYLLLCTTES